MQNMNHSDLTLCVPFLVKMFSVFTRIVYLFIYLASRKLSFLDKKFKETGVSCACPFIVRVWAHCTAPARGGARDQLEQSCARSSRACSAHSASSAAITRELLDSPALPVCMAAGRSPGTPRHYLVPFLNNTNMYILLTMYSYR